MYDMYIGSLLKPQKLSLKIRLQMIVSEEIYFSAVHAENKIAICRFYAYY